MYLQISIGVYFFVVAIVKLSLFSNKLLANNASDLFAKLRFHCHSAEVADREVQRQRSRGKPVKLARQSLGRGYQVQDCAGVGILGDVIFFSGTSEKKLASIHCQFYFHPRIAGLFLSHR